MTENEMTGLLLKLADLGVTGIKIFYSGSGDSGDIDDVVYTTTKEVNFNDINNLTNYGENALYLTNLDHDLKDEISDFADQKILNDIEVIQGIDSGLSGDLKGCSSGGSAYLKSKIEEYFKQNPPAVIPDWQRNLDSSESTILTVTYSFSIPESTRAARGVGTTGIEKRVLEISPSFMSECP